ncbi:hypothetical protein H5410_013631 [Solanum commersonii]|uniref:Uncharacterized protein n=1 Tax=Solanum commersonii TaxID=4109 RepID=A0A9J5ZP06_SOLCO|nr:hypothetical protein H5410_013631 [Solanum commersonii]
MHLIWLKLNFTISQQLLLLEWDFTDAYDLFSISLVTKLLGRLYYTKPDLLKPGTLPPPVAASVTRVSPLSAPSRPAILRLARRHKMGRKKVYGMTLVLMVVCSVASGLSLGHTLRCYDHTMFLGFGLDLALVAITLYLPRSCLNTLNKKTRGAFIAAVFAMQGFGILFSGIVALITSAGFDHAYKSPTFQENAALSTVPQADYIWRIILMFGSLPAALTYYWRMKMPKQLVTTLSRERRKKSRAGHGEGTTS